MSQSERASAGSGDFVSPVEVDAKSSTLPGDGTPVGDVTPESVDSIQQTPPRLAAEIKEEALSNTLDRPIDSPSPQGDITIALQDISNGDSTAIDRLLPLVYLELRQVARNKLRNERADHTLQATALVHEVIVKILGRTTACTWENRRQFFQSAATVMRQILIDSARAKKRAKRAGTVQLADNCPEAIVHDLVDLDLILDLDSNLAQLEKEDSQAAELVKLRLYAGLSVAEAAEVIGISRSKAYEDWMFARFWFSNHGKNLTNP